MIKNYLKMAYRSLLKNKGFTTINVLGLALGLATCLLIVFYVVDELSYDRYNTKADRIYRVNEDLKLGDNKVQYAVCMAPLAQTMKKDFPTVENTTRLKNVGGMHVKKGNENVMEYNALFADPSVFDVFTLPILYGDKATALSEPNTVVLSESTAKKYFNRVNVVGEKLTIDGGQLLKVTAVIQDIPAQSHFHADFLLAMTSFPESHSPEWLRSDFNTYVLMREGASYKSIEAQFPTFLRKYSGGQMESELKMNYDQFEKSGSYFRLNMIPLTDIHLHSAMTGELGVNGTEQYVYIFSAIGLFILLIACINFMNLSTARSSNRAREVGVRKVLGSARKYLIAQFLSESIMITLASVVIALILATGLLPAFNQFTGKSVVINLHTLGWLVPVSLIAVLVIGFLAGLYPAFFLSAFQPIQVLKGKLSTGFKGGGLRSVLVVFQFFISISLIIGTLVIYNQLHYIQSRDLGYNRSHALVIHNAFELGDHAKTFKQEIKQMPGVANATLTSFLPTLLNRSTTIFYKQTIADPKAAIFPQSWSVDEDYIPTLGMKMAAGRNFSNQMRSDSNAIVINETAAKFLGYADPVNRIVYEDILSISAAGTTNTFKPFTIVGVVKDFNFSSLHTAVEPMVLRLNDNTGNLTIKMESADIAGLLTQIQNKWKGLTSAQFEYSFMDQDFDALYKNEQLTGKIAIALTTLAIIIACLGLFGLAAYAAEQRNKEIGIRKVLGASMATIVGMLSMDFIKLVIIAICIASPIAWWGMNKWLQDFAYRIDVQWWVLAVAGLAATLIAFITISFQSIKAALTNPVESLRSE
jgi:putative ABC transport system permease protein